MVHAVLHVPNIKRRVEVREQAATQVADELRADHVETQGTGDFLVILELAGKTFGHALEVAVQRQTGNAGA